MKVLAVDTSTEVGVIAIVEDGQIIVSVEVFFGKNHVERLMPTINSILQFSGLTLIKMDGFAVGVGPGSWTGLRVGIVTLRAIAHILKKPIYPIDSLEVMAHTFRTDLKKIYVFSPMNRRDAYMAVYQNDMETGDFVCIKKPYSLSINSIVEECDTSSLLIGNWASLQNPSDLQLTAYTKEIQTMTIAYPLASSLAHITNDTVKSGIPVAIDAILPVYVLPPRITMSAK